jgi:hypothetical protein
LKPAPAVEVEVHSITIPVQGNTFLEPTGATPDSPKHIPCSRLLTSKWQILYWLAFEPSKSLSAANSTHPRNLREIASSGPPLAALPFGELVQLNIAIMDLPLLGDIPLPYPLLNLQIAGIPGFEAMGSRPPAPREPDGGSVRILELEKIVLYVPYSKSVMKLFIVDCEVER